MNIYRKGLHFYIEALGTSENCLAEFLPPLCSKFKFHGQELYLAPFQGQLNN